jgi:eukaryotic-like serine/threonine-protein kinase
MTVTSGTRLGPYEIVASIGAGGMGEVYRARDTRLGRQVAIKILPAEFAADARLRSRLEREAKLISSLNHPHICTLHDVGHENGVDYLVLEYCEGATLAQRLQRGPLPNEQVLQYGIEIAEALSRAHRAGIVHRDLKPSNIMLTKSGVKLLDFGLAKVEEELSPGESTAHLTSERGTIVGTVQYMAPEVLGGAAADARSDIFALGVVLYEMLTAKPPFSGTSKASVMAAILEHDPPSLRDVKPDTPAALEHVINRCLAKSRDDRSESAHDVAEELRWIRQARPEARILPTRRRIMFAAVGIGALLAAGGVLMMMRKSPPASQRVVRLEISVPEKLLEDPTCQRIAISPDGKRVVYSAQRGGATQIYARRLDSFEATPLDGTENGVAPFFSADGQWIAFFAGSCIRKVPVSGGTFQTITSSLPSGPRGAWWAPDGTIYFSRTYSSGLWRVPAAGGAPTKVTEPDAAAGENSHRWPQVLPDGKHVLFTIRTSEIDSFDDAKIALLSLESGKWRVLLEKGSFARYVSTGHILFARAGALYAVPFDLQSLSILGTPKKVFDGVGTSPGSGTADYSVADTGDLICVPGGIWGGRTEMVAIDRSGHSSVLATLNLTATKPALSPDGRKIAFNVWSANDDIWTYDLDSGVATRFSFDPGDEFCAVWTADGTHIVYSATGRLMVKRADGTGEAEELVRSTDPYVTACSPDNLVAFEDFHRANGVGLWVVPLKGDRTPRALLQSPREGWGASYSPDGKWIVYVAWETPSPEVFARSANGVGARWQISPDGVKGLPKWSADGKEVFYLKDRVMLAVPLSVRGGVVRPGKPQRLFSVPDTFEGGFLSFDVRNNVFLFLHRIHPPDPQQIDVVLNWAQQLGR